MKKMTVFLFLIFATCVARSGSWDSSEGFVVTSTAANSITGGSAGNMLYQTGSGSTGFVGNGTSGQILSSNGSSAPSWLTELSGSKLTGYVNLTSATFSGDVSAYNFIGRGPADTSLSLFTGAGSTAGVYATSHLGRGSISVRNSSGDDVIILSGVNGHISSSQIDTSTVSAYGYQMTGTTAAGYVLTDLAGNGMLTMQPPSGGGSVPDPLHVNQLNLGSASASGVFQLFDNNASPVADFYGDANGASMLNFYDLGDTISPVVSVGSSGGYGGSIAFRECTTIPSGVYDDHYALFYSTREGAAAEMHVIDGAGNDTKISPHADGRWVYDSTNALTGRHIVVDMERLVSVVEKLSGEKLMTETFSTARKMKSLKKWKRK
jgi:hypothetical protein